jgi:hypothetical protein
MTSPARLTTGIAALLLSLMASAPVSAQPVQRTHGPDSAGRSLTASAPRTASVAAAADWCANTDPAANQFPNGDYRYHAVYVHAADRPSRLAALGAQLEKDAFSASALLERQYGRAIRFDVGTPCDPGQLDISEVRLPFTEAELTALSTATHTATFDAVAATLRQHGFGVAGSGEGTDELAARTENYLVWLDGPAPPRSCGQGTALLDGTRSDTNLNNFGGKLAVVFRHGATFCGPNVVRHEIGHNLGALQPDAPNTTDGVHCNDAFEDTMCGVESPKIVGGDFEGLYFDFGNDDYWDPPNGAPLGWWTLNLSRFICPTKDCNRPVPPGPPAAAQATPPPAATPAPVKRAERPAAERRTRTHKTRRPRLARRVSRGHRYTRLRLRARGAGTARLVVRCRRGGPRRRVMSRRVSLPTTVRIRTRCRAPRARLSKWHRPRAGSFENSQ